MKLILFAICVAFFYTMAEADFDSFRISDAWHTENPVIDGQFIVWYGGGSGIPSGIYGYDLNKNEEFSVYYDSDDSSESYYPDISGDIVVWKEIYIESGSDHPGVYGSYLSTGEVFKIADEVSAPKISGSTVIWRNGPYLTGKDLITEKEFNYPIAPLDGTFDIDGEYIITSGHTNYGLEVGTFAIDLSDDSIVKVSDSIGWDYALDQNRAIWMETIWETPDTGDSTIYCYDFVQKEKFIIPTDYGIIRELDISGDLVVWQSVFDATWDTDYDIYGYNLAQSYGFPICTDPLSRQMDPVIYDNLVVWEDNREHFGKIFGAYIPEPCTLSLLACGSLVLWRKRKRLMSDLKN